MNGAVLEFGAMPSVLAALPALYLTRKPALVPAGAVVPRLEARLDGLRVDVRTLEAYRGVCGFTPGPYLPVTLPHVLVTPLHLALLTQPAFPIRLLGVVHVRNAIVAHRPIRVAEPLDWRCVIEGHRETERGQEFELWTRALADGEPVWEECCTFLARRRAAAARGRRRRAPDGAPPPHLAEFIAPADIGRRYARISGDYNPIHLGAFPARVFGFPRALAHGMWTLARCCAELESRWPSGGSRVDVEFRLPVLLPARLALRGRAGDGAVDFELRDEAGQRSHLIGRVAPLS